MKTTLEFFSENPDDAEEFNRMIKATDVCLALLDYQNKLRSVYKYGEPKDTDTASAAEYWRDILLETLDEYGIDLDHLIS